MKVFCVNCDERQDYAVASGFVEEIEKSGVRFRYDREVAFCAKCGHEVYVAEVNDRNVDRRIEAYRRAKDEGTTLLEMS